MMKNKIRLLSWILAALMLLSLVLTACAAAENDTAVLPTAVPTTANDTNAQQAVPEEASTVQSIVKTTDKTLTVDAELIRGKGELPKLDGYVTLRIISARPDDFDDIAKLNLSGASYLSIVMDSDYLAERYDSDEPARNLSAEDRALFEQMADRLRERFPDVYITGALYMNSSDAKLMQSEYVESCTRSELPLEGDIAESSIHFDSRLLDPDDCPQQL